MNWQNQKFSLKSKFNLVQRQHHNVKPMMLFAIGFTGRKQFWSLKRSHNSRILGCHYGPQHCHLAFTCSITVTTVKTIVIAGFSHIRSHKIHVLAFLIKTSVGNDTYLILWLVSDAIFCVTWLINRFHRSRGHSTNFLTVITYSSQSNSTSYLQKNNYVPNPQSNLHSADVRISSWCMPFACSMANAYLLLRWNHKMQ